MKEVETRKKTIASIDCLKCGNALGKVCHLFTDYKGGPIKRSSSFGPWFCEKCGEGNCGQVEPVGYNGSVENIVKLELCDKYMKDEPVVLLRGNDYMSLRDSQS